MQFNLQQATQVLQRTPLVLEALLYGLDDAWITSNEGGDTWNAIDIIAHLILGEKTDWIPRAQVILGNGDKQFVPFDMEGHITERKGKTMNQLLDAFKVLRKDNLLLLQSMNITDEALNRTGIHPILGEVTLSQLLAAWVVHDCSHIHQLSRIMAKQYNEAVGPWNQFMRVLGGKR